MHVITIVIYGLSRLYIVHDNNSIIFRHVNNIIAYDFTVSQLAYIGHEAAAHAVFYENLLKTLAEYPDFFSSHIEEPLLFYGQSRHIELYFRV